MEEKLEAIFRKSSWGRVIGSDMTEEEKKSRHPSDWIVRPWTKTSKRGRGEGLRMCG